MDEKRPDDESADNKNEIFKTPDEVATEQASEPSEIPDDSPVDEGSDMPKKSKWRRFNKLNWPPGKKEWIIFVILLLALAGGGVAYALLHHSKPPTIQPIPKVEAGDPTVPSTLTGLPVDPSVNQRTVTAVMVENSPAARPQSGLGEAGVVFEAVAEGGVTRFMALYQDTAPDNVGPIRSARPYYIQWSMAFDAGYAHVGGSPDGLADIKDWNVRDLDQFHNAGSYHRVSSRAAPHNVYTSIQKLPEKPSFYKLN